MTRLKAVPAQVVFEHRPGTAEQFDGSGGGVAPALAGWIAEMQEGRHAIRIGGVEFTLVVEHRASMYRRDDLRTRSTLLELSGPEGLIEYRRTGFYRPGPQLADHEEQAVALTNAAMDIADRLLGYLAHRRANSASA